MNESKIIPINLQDQLMAIRDSMSRDSWGIGDISIQIVNLNRDNGTGATETEIHKAIGSIVGKASRTIREYIQVSQFYDDHDRELYDVLTFGHFRLALTTSDPRSALEWAVSEVPRTGKPATIDAMMMHCKEIKVPDEPEEVNPMDKLLGFGGAIRDYIDQFRERLPKDLVEKVWKQTHEMDTTLREVAEMVEKSYTV